MKVAARSMSAASLYTCVEKRIAVPRNAALMRCSARAARTGSGSSTVPLSRLPAGRRTRLRAHFSWGGRTSGSPTSSRSRGGQTSRTTVTSRPPGSGSTASGSVPGDLSRPAEYPVTPADSSASSTVGRETSRVFLAARESWPRVVWAPPAAAPSGCAFRVWAYGSKVAVRFQFHVAPVPQPSMPQPLPVLSVPIRCQSAGYLGYWIALIQARTVSNA
jgi:hypothetical protein